MNHERLITCFKEVAAISRIGGAGPDPSRETVEHQIKIILSEANELVVDGFGELNRHEVRDGIGDVLFTVAGAYARFDIPFPNSFEPVELNSYNEAEETSRKIIGILNAMQILADKNLMDYYVVMGLLLKDIAEKAISIANYFGLPYINDLEAICASQWTKFDSTSSAGFNTVERYTNSGVEVYQEVRRAHEREYIVTHSAKDQNDLKGRPIPKGKWLKSVNFEEPEFEKVEWKNDEIFECSAVG